MTREELISKCKEFIEQTEKSVDEGFKLFVELYKKYEKDENDERKKRWRAKEDEEYYYIDTDGCAFRGCDRYTESEYYKYNIGNYFQTKQQAERYKEKQLIRQELEDLAMELNIEPIDWENAQQSKFCVTYCPTSNFELDSHTWIKDINIYCTNENFLDEALKRIGEDRLKILFEVE
jgi:NAD-dependent dihydropyrimidine dehydrogenase PreA subunit